ncbi:MAG: hypothetical protein AAFO94_11495, partial [Bacteroidota bacterium]
GQLDCGFESVFLNVNTTATDPTFAWFYGSGDAEIKTGDENKQRPEVFGAGEYVVVVTDNATQCTAEQRVEVTDLRITPRTPSSIPNSEICAGTNASYTANSTDATSYRWVLPPGASFNGPDDAATVSIDWADNATGGEICVYGVRDCKESENPRCFDVAITPVPAAPTIDGENLACASSNETYEVQNPVTDETYTWSLESGTGVMITSGTTGPGIDLSFAANATDARICATPSNDCGDGPISCFDITVAGLPTAPTAITGNTDVCTGSSQSFSIDPVANATQYNWTRPDGTTITGTTDLTINFAANATSGNLCVTAENNCGISDPFCVPISVQSAPAQPDPVSTIATSVCQSDAGVVYSVPSAADVDQYNWTVPTGATLSGQGSNIISVDFGTAAISGDICVTAENDCGVSTPRCIAIEVESRPAQPQLTGNNTICRGAASETFSIAVIANADEYIWTAPTGVSLSLNANQTVATASFAANANSGDICVTARNQCGDSDIECFSFSIVNEPTIPVISGQAAVCANTTESYTTTATGATNITWTVPTGVQITSGQNTTAIATNISSTALSGDICVTVSNDCGMETDCFPISVAELPPPPAQINGDAAHCAGSTNTNYNITPISGATEYAWTVPAGATIVSGSDQTNVVIDWAASATGGQICARAINDCGPGAQRCLTVVVNPIPTADFTVETPICSDNNGKTALCAWSAVVDSSGTNLSSR